MDSCSGYERKNHGAVYVVCVRGGGVLRSPLRIRDRAGVCIATDGLKADSRRARGRRFGGRHASGVLYASSDDGIVSLW